MTPSSPAAHAEPDVAVVILAAGSGTRFGSDKMMLQLGGKHLWRWSYDVFAHHPAVKEVILVGGERLGDGVSWIPGGEARQDSSRLGVDAVTCEPRLILVHDAARPFISAEVIDAVIAGCRSTGAAAPVIPVADTLRSLDVDGPTIDRSRLVAMQTPQGGSAEIVRRAHAAGSPICTDEIALIEAIGAPWERVPGSTKNFKVTVPEDFDRARSMLRHQVRTGLGYDVHAFSPEADRPLFLGGIHFPDHPALAGHSDADVLLHAITDALLGAAALGDIGEHFPPSDPRWKNEPSLTFLTHAGRVLNQAGWEVAHIDSQVIAESPRVMPFAGLIRERIADGLGISVDCVSVKATTHEGLGAIGRSEGIAAYATATIERWTA